MATISDFNRIVDMGFDDSEIPARANSRGERAIKVRCSQCVASVINGEPCHEHGCPNQTNECHGCNAIVERHQKYCQDCMD